MITQSVTQRHTSSMTSSHRHGDVVTVEKMLGTQGVRRQSATSFQVDTAPVDLLRNE